MTIRTCQKQKTQLLIFSQEAALKRRVRRNVKAPKAVAGLSYTELLAKKQQKPEVILKLSFIRIFDSETFVKVYGW